MLELNISTSMGAIFSKQLSALLLLDVITCARARVCCAVLKFTARAGNNNDDVDDDGRDYKASGNIGFRANFLRSARFRPLVWVRFLGAS